MCSCGNDVHVIEGHAIHPVVRLSLWGDRGRWGHVCDTVTLCDKADNDIQCLCKHVVLVTVTL